MSFLLFCVSFLYFLCSLVVFLLLLLQISFLESPLYDSMVFLPASLLQCFNFILNILYFFPYFLQLLSYLFLFGYLTFIYFFFWLILSMYSLHFSSMPFSSGTAVFVGSLPALHSQGKASVFWMHILLLWFWHIWWNTIVHIDNNILLYHFHHWLLPCTCDRLMNLANHQLVLSFVVFGFFRLFWIFWLPLSLICWLLVAVLVTIMFLFFQIFQ